MENEEVSFEEWFDAFKEFVRMEFNYHGPVDRETFEGDFEEGLDPRETAKNFVEEMND